jgi:hypothetical protein
MIVRVTESATSVQAVTWVKVADAPPVKADGIDLQISPYAVEISYVYHRVAGPDGWIEHRWLARGVAVHGQHILKPAKDGTERLGASVYRATWSSFGGRDLVDSTSVGSPPEWVLVIIESHRPSGELFLAGIPG